jgi:acetyl-CoA/propionyl-CoA carboxylase carboxyl transferase subunit
VLGLWHSGGARLAEGVLALDAVGQVFAAMVRASGRVPQISVVLGPAAGGAAYGPALTDIVVMAGGGRIFVTGPEVVRSVTGEQVDMERLGGPEPHGRRSGVVHVTTKDDESALGEARKLAHLLGRQGRLSPADVPVGDVEGHDMAAAMPAEASRAYDVKPVVKALLDGEAVELHARWAPNIVTTLGRFAGRTVGVIANNPLRLGGCLDSAGAEKAARFVRKCDEFGLPLLVLVDTPGFLPGTRQEARGVIRHGAGLLHAFAAAKVPKLTVVLRKAYGGGFITMNSKDLGADLALAWPDAEIGIMGPRQAVGIVRRREIAEADDPEEAHARLTAEYADEHLSATVSAREGYVDEVVEPAATRERIESALAAFA